MKPCPASHSHGVMAGNRCDIASDVLKGFITLIVPQANRDRETIVLPLANREMERCLSQQLIPPVTGRLLHDYSYHVVDGGI